MELDGELPLGPTDRDALYGALTLPGHKPLNVPLVV
jgi:hypothetical protein